MKEKTRVLVISYLPWRNDVNVGNTLSNLFSGMQDDFEFASIYFKGGRPSNSIASRYFYIPEKELLRSIVNRKPVGYVVEGNSAAREQPSSLYNRARTMRWESMLLAQDCIGILGKWKSSALDEFIRNYRPHMVFGPLGRVPAANILMCHIHRAYHIPLVTYAWDDHYSLHKTSLSPFFWAKTFLERKYIRRCAAESSFLYAITQEMCDEYSGYFHKECRLLFKSYPFNHAPAVPSGIHRPVKLVYMGNIALGRWQVLAQLARSIQEINRNGKKALLQIYTMSPKSDRIQKALNLEGCSQLMDPVPNDRLLSTMEGADILVHTEPVTRKGREFFRLSFSTKLTDYMYAGRCILACGGRTASISYLERNDAAIIVPEGEDFVPVLQNLLSQPDTILEYGKKAWDCGVRNHQRDCIRDMLCNDFNTIAQEVSL